MATKKHQDLSGVEAQRLGLLRGSDSKEARALRAKVNAQAKFAELEQVEAEAARVHHGPGIARGGAQARDEQLAEDAQLIGRYGQANIKDPALAERVRQARARLAGDAAVRAAPKRLEEARAAYDSAFAYAERAAAEAAMEAREREIASLQRDLEDATRKQRSSPRDSIAADRVARISTKIAELQQQTA